MVRFYQKHFRRQYPVGLMGLVVAGVWLRFAAVVSWIQYRRLWARGRQLTAAPRSLKAGSMRVAHSPLPLDGAVMPIVDSSRPLSS